MEKFITTVKGVSASGKSSRTLMTMKFLEHKGFKMEKLEHTNINGKTKEIGFLFPELNNLLFIGSTHDYHGVERFQGYDSMTGQFEGAANFSDFLRDNIDKYCFVIEGAGITGTNRLRPKFLYEYVGCKSLYMQYYNYREYEKDVYMERVFYRSGKYPGEQMWSKVRMFNVEPQKSEKEFQDLVESGINDFYFICQHDYSESPIYDFGCKLLALYGEYGLDPIEFVGFCTEQDYISKNKYIQ